MKGLFQYTLAASVAAGAAALSHHGHQHLHAKKHAASRIEKRDPDQVVYVAAATDVVYILDGQVVSAQVASKGIKDGEYLIVGETTPTFTPPPPPKSTTTPDMGAQFIESISTTSTTSSAAPTTTSTTSTTVAPTTSSSTTSVAASSAASSAPVANNASAPPASSSSGTSGGQGVTSEFPSGTIPCSQFPSAYGAVALDWMNLGGWSGIQYVPQYNILAEAISDIITAVGGQTCTKNAMCSYACPDGYQKTQWPTAQGATKQSIGGLYCNANGYLELSRPSSKTLCETGVGGVTIQNDLTEVVSTCRTDYPGTENMVIPAIAQAGSSIPLTNPDQNTYYNWGKLATSAQYYVNKKGLGPSDACLWTSPVDPTGAGNWAPVILGVGRASDGITFISIFQNLPTSTALLDFSIEITGDVNSKCSYVNGEWTGGQSGCTTGMPSGGSAVIRFF